MFSIHSNNGYTEITKGIKIKTLCHGEAMCMVEFLLTKSSLLPEHAHSNEQTGYLVKGNIRLFINGVARELLPGDSWSIPGNCRHSAEVMEDSTAIEVFNPVREDYLPYENREDTIL
jgi:quercetin dioxygenase-like cupin family protein